MDTFTENKIRTKKTPVRNRTGVLTLAGFELATYSLGARSIQKRSPMSGVNIDGNVLKSICNILRTLCCYLRKSATPYLIRKAQATIANNAQPSTNAEVRIMLV